VKGISQVNTLHQSFRTYAVESLQGFNAFVYAAEQQSYVAAGRILGISPSAVSKSISRLEARYGVRLLNRTTRSIGMTEEGTAFYQLCKRILGDIAEAESFMRQSAGKPMGRLRVSVPQVFGRYLLLPILSEFAERYPDIDLDVEFDDQVVDLIAMGFDIAVRTGDLADNRLVARRIGEQHFVVCGNTYYLDRHGIPRTPVDLDAHACIHFKYPSSGRLAPWSFTGTPVTPRLSKGLVFNSTEAGLWAASNGLGLAHLPYYMVREQIAAGELQPVLAEFMAPFGSLWLVWPSNRQLSPRVRAFTDFVVEKLQAMPGGFSSVDAIHSRDG
jgi:DNA-binding transcriptional LysR family regulator